MKNSFHKFKHFAPFPREVTNLSLLPRISFIFEQGWVDLREVRTLNEVAVLDPVVVPVPAQVGFLVLSKHRGGALYQRHADHPPVAAVGKVDGVAKPDEAIASLHVETEVLGEVGGLGAAQLGVLLSGAGVVVGVLLEVELKK